MINLVNQNKHHARKYTAILQKMTMWKCYILTTYPKVAQHDINLFAYINTFPGMYKKIVGIQQNLSVEG